LGRGDRYQRVRAAPGAGCGRKGCASASTGTCSPRRSACIRFRSNREPTNRRRPQASRRCSDVEDARDMENYGARKGRLRSAARGASAGPPVDDLGRVDDRAAERAATTGTYNATGPERPCACSASRRRASMATGGRRRAAGRADAELQARRRDPVAAHPVLAPAGEYGIMERTSIARSPPPHIPVRWPETVRATYAWLQAATTNARSCFRPSLERAALGASGELTLVRSPPMRPLAKSYMFCESRRRVRCAR